MLNTKFVSSVYNSNVKGLLQILPPVLSQCSKNCSHKSPKNEEAILKDFINRNPRSMELLRIERKPQGYSLDTPTINYYYRLMFELTQKHVTGWVEHNSGEQVISASTKEWAIRKHLFSSKDIAAAENVGRVLGRRCLQAGIYEMHTDLEKLADTSSKIKLFLDAVQSEGVTFGEAPQIREKQTYATCDQIPTFPWEVSEEYVDKLKDSDLATDDLVPR